ncbi:glycerophosphodiester phosphodiesterase [Aromatoleum diolicum]|uniref:Glycerophosphodiester phosphodiesterase n=1 Tax=Aromatoleum diolicum TaxID=75796 RepID=A0ABX1QCY4_9RHOO|nr:glycerophosphodiester phosphodiesterase [Aromatoleum diolicum]NMG76264.1 glycerophosphodiester phosphodiesterase [Aromatoleum diolicum]
MPRHDWPLPAVLAHRCGGTLAPENTLAGLDAALGNACGGVEFDVMLSGSGSPVLIHDETLERTTNGRGPVADTPDEILRALDAGAWFDRRFAGEPLPTLEAAAARCKALGLAVNLEIKPSEGAEEATAEVVVRRARELWAGASELLLSSFSERALEVAATLAPELRRGLLVSAIPKDWQMRCRRLGVVALHVAHKHLDATNVAAVRDAGLWVVAYTVNDPLRARTLFEWGVDCVITDRPDIVRSLRP